MGSTWTAFSVEHTGDRLSGGAFSVEHTGDHSSGGNARPGSEHKMFEGLGDLIRCDWAQVHRAEIRTPLSAGTYQTSVGADKLFEECKVSTYKNNLSECRT